MAQAKGKIMIAIDGSSHSERAINFYLDNLRRPNDELLLAHCIEIPYQHGFPLRPEVMEEILTRAKSDALKEEIKVKELMQNKGVEFRIVSEFGIPGEYIVEKAKEEQVSMIVMGTRGMGKIRRTILGSVSDFVVHHAHCPIVVART